MPHTFNEFAEIYIKTAALAYSTRLSYAASLAIYWQPYLGTKLIEDIGYLDLLQIDEQTNWLSLKTRKNSLAPLRGVFALAYLHNRWPLQSSPAHQIKLGRHQTARPDPFSKDDRDKIMAWMQGKPQGLYFRTAFATGMRSGELIALEWSQYDGESLRVHQSRVRGRIKGTKTMSERNVYLPAWLCRELNNHWTQSYGDAIFLNQYKKPYQKPDKLNRVFRRCLSELNIRARNGPYPWRTPMPRSALPRVPRPPFSPGNWDIHLRLSIAPMRIGYRETGIRSSGRLLSAAGRLEPN